MPILHKNISASADIHNPKWFSGANSGDYAWKNELGNLESTDELVLPAGLNFVDASVSPPTTNAGDIYVLSSGVSVDAGWGAVALKDWVRYDGTDWNAITPQKSSLCYNENNDTLYSYDGTDWNTVGGGDSIYTKSDKAFIDVEIEVDGSLSFTDGVSKLWEWLDNGNAYLRGGGEIVVNSSGAIKIGSDNTFTTLGINATVIGHDNNIVNGGYSVTAIGRDIEVTGGAFDTANLGIGIRTSAGLSTALGALIQNNSQYTVGLGINVQNTATGAMTIGRGLGIASYANALVNSTANSLALGWNSLTPQHLFTSSGAIINGNTKIASENNLLNGVTYLKGSGTTTGTTLALYDSTDAKTWEWLDNGDATGNGLLTIDNTGGDNLATDVVAQKIISGGGLNAGARIEFYNALTGAGTPAGVIQNKLNGASDPSFILGDFDQEELLHLRNASVGINEANPQAKLHVNGTLLAEGLTTIDNTGGDNLATDVVAQKIISGGGLNAGARIEFYNALTGAGTPAGVIQNKLNGTNDPSFILGDFDQEELLHLRNARVGINEANPQETLHLNGTLRVDGQTATGATAGADTLPSNPVGFITINLDGTNYKVPYYNV